MADIEGATHFQGESVTLEGNNLQPHTKAPAVTLLRDLREQQTLDFDDDKVHLITTALSVDTTVCANQLYEFDRRAIEANNTSIEYHYVSRDLPFALKRMAKEKDIKKFNVLSDYYFKELGDKFGLTVAEFDLLARSAWVIDRDGNVAYKEVVPEITNEPDYNAAMSAALNAAANS